MISLNKSNFIWEKINQIKEIEKIANNAKIVEEIQKFNSKEELAGKTLDITKIQNILKHIANETISKQSDTSIDEYYVTLHKYIQKWKQSLESGTGYLKTYFDLLDDTHALVVQEQQLLPHNVTERPVPLSSLLNCSSAEYSTFLTSASRTRPQHVIDLIIFGYELSIIEIRLYEFYDVVDEFIIFETNITFKKTRKPFFFHDNLIRYQRFLDKITLITPFNITTFNSDGTVKKKIDVAIEYIPAEYRSGSVENNLASNEKEFFRIDWAVESRVRMIPLDLYMKYVRNINSDELVIHGDVDEIPDSNIINHFKHCQVQNLYPFNFWSTFYTYGFKFLFQADFAAKTDKYSNLFPNIFQMKNILALKSLRTTKGFVLPRASGAHCNRFFTTFTIPLYKDVSQSDSTGLEAFHLNIIKNGSKDILYGVRERYDKGDIYEKYLHRIKKINVSKQNHEGKSFVPWVVLANKYIYEKFF